MVILTNISPKFSLLILPFLVSCTLFSLSSPQSVSKAASSSSGSCSLPGDAPRFDQAETDKYLRIKDRRDLREYTNGGCVVTEVKNPAGLVFEGRESFSCEFDGQAALASSLAKAVRQCLNAAYRIDPEVQKAIIEFIPENAWPRLTIPAFISHFFKIGQAARAIGKFCTLPAESLVAPYDFPGYTGRVIEQRDCI